MENAPVEDAPMIDVDTELLHIVTKRNRLRDPAFESLASIASSHAAIQATMGKLKAYPEELRRTILHEVRGKGRTSIFYWVSEGWNTVTFNEYFAYCDVLDEESPRHLLNGLRKYPQLPTMDDYSTANDETKQLVRGILTVAQKLLAAKEKELFPLDPWISELPIKNGGPMGKSITITNAAIVDLIVAYPAKAQQIAGTIIDRKTLDVELIRNIITNSAAPLNHGIL